MHESSFLEDAVQEFRQEIGTWRRPTIGDLATLLLASLTIIAVMGALVFWIRAGNAGLPRAQTVTLIPRQELLIVGARELGGPMLFILILNLLAFPIGGAVGKRGVERRAATEGLAGVQKGLKRRIEVGELIASCFRSFAVAALLFYGLDWSTAVLSLSLVAYSFIFSGSIRRPSVRVLIGLALVIGFGSALAKEADSGPRFDQATLVVSDGAVDGYYIARSMETTYVGDDGVIVAIPNRRVEEVRIAHAEVVDPVPKSIFDHLSDSIGRVF